MVLKLKVRKWGNSKAVILPYDYAQTVKIGQEITMEPVQQLDFKKWFGKYKTGETGQQFKDRVRDLSE